jgi:1-acyl-sn-glycerol-3-phosphate acyltransferase
MNVLKNILARIMAVWAMIVFISSMFIILIPILICGIFKEPKRSHFLQPLFQLWMTFFFVFSGVRRKFVGRKNFNGKTYIVVCNHNSLLDPPLSSPGIPEANKTIAKIEMAKIPLFGLIYKRGSVLVDRKNDESRKQSYADMKKVLEMGLHMCIYPEGTRNKTTEPLQRFHDGAFRLAVDTNTPVIPSLLFHTKKVMPSNKTFYFWPHPVEMHFLPPVSPAGKSIQELKEEVFEIMKTYYLQHNH